MAKSNKSGNPGSLNTSDVTVNGFTKGLVKDNDDTFMPEGSWFHARNVVNNSNLGDIGIIGNEPSNIHCVNLTYTMIGAISIIEEYWAVFSTDNTTSEIGLFNEKSCEYCIISRDTQWNFNTNYVIIGASKRNFDCSFQLYWCDGFNPDRILNIGDIFAIGTCPNVLNNEPWPNLPYVCEDVLPGPCIDCVPIVPLTIDIERTRLAKIYKVPCVKIDNGYSGGQLLNGSYYATIAYSVNQQRVTDYFNPSQSQPIFNHENPLGSLDITFSNLETNVFEEFELVIVSTINQQTVARTIGYYSTNTNSISIDFINPELPSVPIQYIPLRTPAYEKSEGVYAVGEYLIRNAITTKFDFNYQPLANQIDTEWVMIEQPYDYYQKGGNENGYLRDEQYCFWVRWIYNTGERSSSYHIPGRPSFAWEQQPVGPSNLDAIEYSEDSAYAPKTWEVYNTAYATSPVALLPSASASVTPGQIVAFGKMGYWESTEVYPDNKPEVWNSSSQTWSGTTDPIYDLCGQPIRHHKMPADFIYSNGNNIVDNLNNYSHVRIDTTQIPNDPKAIRILGVRFNNIKAPVDNYGNVIPGIVGYEILRSNRQGNRTIIAKGILNNMRYYDVDSGDEVLYQNYVGNYLGPDYSLTKTDIITNPAAAEIEGPTANAVDWYRQDYFSFHSPDTMFEKPFLNAVELKLYGEVGSAYNMKGQFEPVPGHPKEKLLTNNAFAIALFLGIGYAGRQIRGKDTYQRVTPRALNLGLYGAAPPANLWVSGAATTITGGITPTSEDSLYNNSIGSPASIITALAGQSVGGTFGEIAEDATITGILTQLSIPTTPVPPINNGGFGPEYIFGNEKSDFQYNPLGAIIGLSAYGSYWLEGSDAFYNLLRALVPFRDLVYRSLCYIDYNNLQLGGARSSSQNTRRHILDSNYIGNQRTMLGGFEVNNLYRSKFVGLQVSNPLIDPSRYDNSVQTIRSIINTSPFPPNYTDTINYKIRANNISSGYFRANASCYYSGLKVRYRNQYGQIESPKQIPTDCVFNLLPNGQPLGPDVIDYSNPNEPISTVVVLQTPLILGGDVYIGRYTEKNTFFYFYDWLYNVPDGTELDYRTKIMISYPRYWADFTKVDFSEVVAGIAGGILSLSVNGIFNSLPSGRYELDKIIDQPPNTGFSSFASLTWGVKNQAMYLFQSGVREFFVESEYNVDHRDWGDLDDQRFYDPYEFTDLKTLFDTNIIKVGNYYKYDISLGVSKTLNSYISWGNMQERSYDPAVSEKCFTYLPNRVIYSLPQNFENKKDYWQIFLVNNYYDFDDRVTVMKPINRNGAIILFAKSSPVQFYALDQLQTTGGTKITIGDGGLFSQPLQSLSNADREFQHGSCQNRLSVINTPAGVYWMSASQGKIFTLSENLTPISDFGMKWWFNKYLKFFLLDYFPNYEITDNPVTGIGCQSLFDNENSILYFCKKDYVVKDQFVGSITYQGDNVFTIVNSGVSAVIKLGDPEYFDDVSWTLSFDVKAKAWISFHDWHPEFTLSSIRGFLTTQTDNGSTGIWRHGNFTHNFCNFYGTNYPWEIDYVAQTGQIVTTTRSIEYLLQSYVYDSDGIDRYQVLDNNFDEAVIYNTEQVSGQLNLVLNPKNNAPLIVNYPITNPSSYDILYSREEQKTRFNQFWDITRDRGEFAVGGVFAQQPIWDTELNGYIRGLNLANLNYLKSPFERKRFRHFSNHVVLKKNISDNIKMMLKVVNDKLLNSPR